jgi:hypothetical protein
MLTATPLKIKMVAHDQRRDQKQTSKIGSASTVAIKAARQQRARTVVFSLARIQQELGYKQDL